MIGVDALSRHILDSVIELSAKLNLGIVAEGVENEEQSDYLTEKGVEYLQGYLFARPLIGDQFITSLLTRFDKRAYKNKYYLALQVTASILSNRWNNLLSVHAF